MAVTQQPEERIAQSTTLIKQLLEHLPVEKILEFRESTIQLHKNQLALIDEMLQSKGYVKSSE